MERGSLKPYLLEYKKKTCHHNYGRNNHSPGIYLESLRDCKFAKITFVEHPCLKPRNKRSIIPLVRANAVEHPIGLSDTKNVNQLRMPIPAPTTYGDHSFMLSHSISYSSFFTIGKVHVLCR